MSKYMNFVSGSIRGVMLESDRILLARESYEGRWETPGGRITKGEIDHVEVLKREFFEETGYEVRVGNIIDFNFNDDPQLGAAFNVLCRVYPLRRSKEPEAGTETKWFSKQDVEKMLRDKTYDIHDRRVLELYTAGLLG